MTPADRLRRTFSILLFGAIGGVLAARAADRTDLAKAAADPAIELPKFVVTDTRALPEPEHWRYATIPGFEILSNAPDRQTDRLIRDFELFKEVLDDIWPVPAKYQTPVLLILCGRGGKFRSFVPAGSDGGPAVASASLFLKGRVRTAIVIDLESTVINILPDQVDDPSSGIDSTHFAIEHNKVLYREYVHYLLSRSEPRLPAWFEEGMAQIVMAMRFDRKYIEFGRLEDPNRVSTLQGLAATANQAQSDLAASLGDTSSPALQPLDAPVEDRDFNAALARKALIPMKDFFAVSYDSPEARNPLGNNTWAKQAYAFVHMGLYGENGRWQKPFMQFLIRSAQAPVTEAMFKDCFQMSYRDMGLQLRGYIQWAHYTVQEYQAKGGGLPLPGPLALRDATQSETARIKGEAYDLGGHRAEARNELIAPYIRGERDPQLLADLGLSEHTDGKDDRARKFLAAAIASKTTNPDAYLQLAQYRYADALDAPAAGKAFSSAQVTAVKTLLDGARRLRPPSMETYDLYAETLIHAAAKPTHDDIAPLVEGVRLFPGHLKLVYETAGLCADAGLYDAAHSLVEHGVRFAPDAATKASFQKLAAALPPEQTPASLPAKR